jgi:outer membrane protein
MNMPHWLLIAAVLSGCSLPCTAGDWTLDRALADALKTAGDVRIEQLSSEEAALDADNARSRQYPQFTLGAGANYVSKVMEIDMPFKSIRFGDNDSYDFSLAIRQLIYDGGRLVSLRKAGEARIRAGEFSAETGRLAVELKTKTAFFQVLMAENLVAAAERSREEATRHLDAVTSLRKQGMALENDVSRARLRVSTAALEMTTRNADLTRARALFRRMVGCGPDEPVVLVWSGSYSTPIDSTNNRALLGNRPELRAFAASREASVLAGKAAGAGLLPSVGLGAAYHYGRPGLDQPANDWMSYATAGLTFSWNLWDWGETHREMTRAAIAARRIDERRSEFSKELDRQLTDAEASYTAARERLALAREASGLAEETLAVAETSYREGMMTETDYDNAHTALARTRIEAAAAETSVWIGAAQVEYVLGIRSSGDRQ